ncbi:MAG: hypothetical protein ABEJ64_04190 [Candidatus Nanohaloarchaea archaeon]
MPNDRVDQQRRTTKGAVEKHQEETGRLRGGIRSLGRKLGAVDDLEHERDVTEDQVVRDNQAFQSYTDQNRSVLGEMGDYLGNIGDQILWDRRTFLAGLAALGGYQALSDDYQNNFSGDKDAGGGFRPSGRETGDDIDLWGHIGRQTEPHKAAEGKPSPSNGMKPIEETLERGDFKRVWGNMDRSLARQIMGTEEFQRYYDGRDEELMKFSATYTPDKSEPSMVEYWFADLSEVDGGIENIGEDDLKYGGQFLAPDRAVQEYVQTAEEVLK